MKIKESTFLERILVNFLTSEFWTFDHKYSTIRFVMQSPIDYLKGQL